MTVSDQVTSANISVTSANFGDFDPKSKKTKTYSTREWNIITADSLLNIYMFARLLVSQKRGPPVNIQQYNIANHRTWYFIKTAVKSTCLPSNLISFIALILSNWVSRGHLAEITVGRGHMYTKYDWFRSCYHGEGLPTAHSLEMNPAGSYLYNISNTA